MLGDTESRTRGNLSKAAKHYAYTRNDSSVPISHIFPSTGGPIFYFPEAEILLPQALVCQQDNLIHRPSRIL
jgi:hypothetical protein